MESGFALKAESFAPYVFWNMKTIIQQLGPLM
jgi:hypothetical protein